MGATTTFTVHLSNQQATAGLSLRGSCNGAAAARQLEQAVAELVATHPPFVWVDCRRLTFLSWHAQRAIFNAHQQARVAGAVLYWCGFSPGVLSQLADTGLHLLLSVLPATAYQGPRILLLDQVPNALHTRQFKGGAGAAG
jgi:anti-anti-sigma regulatory factor